MAGCWAGLGTGAPSVAPLRREVRVCGRRVLPSAVCLSAGTSTLNQITFRGGWRGGAAYHLEL